MIEHLVLFKFKEEISKAMQEEVYQSLMALKESVPSIADISAGVNFSDRAQGFDGGLVVRLRSKEDLQAYIGHPEHQRVVNDLIKPIVENVLAVDYQF